MDQFISGEKENLQKQVPQSIHWSYWEENLDWCWTREIFFLRLSSIWKVMYLICHSQQMHRDKDGAPQFWGVKENLQKHFLHSLHWSDSKWKACLAGGREEIRKFSSTVLILQEQLCISELFKDIQNAILLILRYKTMWLFKTTSPSV